MDDDYLATIRALDTIRQHHGIDGMSAYIVIADNDNKGIVTTYDNLRKDAKVPMRRLRLACDSLILCNIVVEDGGALRLAEGVL